VSSRVKWLFCLLLFGATLVNYLDRQTISVSASRIAEEMQLTDRDLGRLFFGFLFSYGIAQLFIGPLLDRFRVVTAYAVAVAAWSLAGAGAALATGFTGLFAARLLLGICEAPNWPLALRVTARIFPPHQRSLAIGIFQSGTSVGALVAPPVIIWLTQRWDWRTAFVVCGGIGLVWAVLWLACSRIPGAEVLAEPGIPERTVANPTLQASSEPSTFREIIRSRVFWGLVVATSFANPLQYFYTTWLPRYFDRYAGVGFGRELAARLVLVYFALDLGLWLGGGGVAWLARRFALRRARLVVAGIGTLGMMLVPFVSAVRSLNLITAIICAATFGLGCFMVNYLSFVAEVSRTRVSTAAGLLGGVGSLTGGAFMLWVGGSVERSQSFTLAFLLAGALPLVAFAGLNFGARSQPQTSATPTAEVRE